MEFTVKLKDNIYKKKTGQPDMVGQTLINGVACGFAAWKNNDGSLNVKVKPIEVEKK